MRRLHRASSQLKDSPNTCVAASVACESEDRVVSASVELILNVLSRRGVEPSEVLRRAGDGGRKERVARRAKQSNQPHRPESKVLVSLNKYAIHLVLSSSVSIATVRLR